MFSGSSGLNVKIDPVRLPYDPETGVQDLAVAFNVDHDQTGRVSRRKGFSATSRTEDIHSLFCDNGPCLFVAGSKLCLLSGDYSKTELATVTPGARMRYLQLNNRVYYANGHQTGFIENGSNNSWVMGAYYGPETDRQFVDPPLGSRLAFHGGSIWVTQGSVAWHSEPFAFNWFDLARNFLPFEGEIRMFRPVTSGIFVSLEDKTLFIEGTLSNDMKRRRTVANYPAIEDTDVELDASKIGSGEMSGQAALWTTPEGICVGLPTGEFLNLTQRKLLYPTALRGAGLALDNRYISLLEP